MIWGSRLTNTKGRELYKSIDKNNIQIKSGGSPTYWPTDPTKIPDLLDFFLSKGLSNQMFSIENSFELSTDHSPVILTCCRAVANQKYPLVTHYKMFRENIGDKLNVRVNLLLILNQLYPCSLVRSQKKYQIVLEL